MNVCHQIYITLAVVMKKNQEDKLYFEPVFSQKMLYQSNRTILSDLSENSRQDRKSGMFADHFFSKSKMTKRWHWMWNG